MKEAYQQQPLDLKPPQTRHNAPGRVQTPADDFHDLYRFENDNRARLDLPEVSPQEFRQIVSFFDYGNRK